MGRDRALAAPSSYKGGRGRRERGGEQRDKGRERVRGRGHAHSSSTALHAVMKIKSPGQGMSQKPPDVSGTVTLGMGGGGGRGDPEHRVKEGAREQMLPIRLTSCHLQEGAIPALPPGTPVRPGHRLDSSQAPCDSWLPWETRPGKGTGQRLSAPLWQSRLREAKRNIQLCMATPPVRTVPRPTSAARRRIEGEDRSLGLHFLTNPS